MNSETKTIADSAFSSRLTREVLEQTTYYNQKGKYQQKFREPETQNPYYEVHEYQAPQNVFGYKIYAWVKETDKKYIRIYNSNGTDSGWRPYREPNLTA